MRKQKRKRIQKKKVYKKKICKFCVDKIDRIDYKDTFKLKRYLTERGKIIPRRITGNCTYHQRQLAKVIKRARASSIIPFVAE